MIRPLHYILNGKQLSDIVAPITGKAEELETFAEVQQEQAKAERARADAAYQQAKDAFGVACGKATQRYFEAIAALEVASKLRKIVA